MSKHSLSKGSKKFRKNTYFSFLGRKKYKGVPRILGQNPMVSKIKVLTTSYPECSFLLARRGGNTNSPGNKTDFFPPKREKNS